MILNSVYAYWLKGSEAYVQRDLRRLNATIPYPPQNFWGEVQSRGGGRY
jgi:hypothetical protein